MVIVSLVDPRFSVPALVTVETPARPPLMLSSVAVEDTLTLLLARLPFSNTVPALMLVVPV